MIDINLIRENSDFVKKNLEKRNEPKIIEQLEKMINLDKERRAMIKKFESLKNQRNIVTKEISDLAQKNSNEQITELKEKAKKIVSEIKNMDEQMLSLNKDSEKTLMNIPNLLDETVPEGKDDSENTEIKKFGQKPEFSFEPKNHLDILQKLGMLDIERATKVSGHGFYFLKGDAVLLDIALQRFTLDLLKKKGFTLIEPPLMLNEETFMRVTDWETFNDQAYKIEGENLRIIGTAEHPLGSFFKDEFIMEKDLPILFAGVSPCFRKEVGAHGKYTKGLFRVHHFNKVEQFVFCLPKDSKEWHEKIQKNSEEIYDKLGLHYRTVNVCTGDIGSIASKKYDTEVWMTDGKFRESGSNSNCTDYQARRLKIKYKEKEGAPVKGFVHTLNNTALATSRIIIAIVEQFQQVDGSVKIPDVLQEYCKIKKLR